jgi:hypothetical protein
MAAVDPVEKPSFYQPGDGDTAPRPYAAFVLEQWKRRGRPARIVVLIEQRVDFSRWVKAASERPNA